MNCPLCQSANGTDARRCRACGAALKTQSSENGAVHLPDALPDDALLIGTYAVEGVLGQGGFGITYRSHDQMLDRHVAIKEFFPSGCRREHDEVWPARGLSDTEFREARTQFLAEARVLARCHHAGIVSVHTAFEANKTAYMVMELLHGKTLAQLITARGGRMKEAEAVEIIERVGDALGFVHDLDLLHRDIKPDNIIVCDDGRVMLIDFGTAREFVKGQAQGQTVVVTPGYAPLEQYAKQAKRGAFTDIYSLSATLYHLLTGQMPPAASDRAMGVQLRSVRELNPQISASVARAVESALQMEIAKRPQSVREFLDLLHAPVEQVEVLFHPQLIDLSFDENEDADADANLLPQTLTPDAIRARQQSWQGAMPSANTQPVQIAPQRVFDPNGQPSVPVPPSAYNPATGRILVNQPDNSNAGWWWLFALVALIGFFTFLSSSGNRNNTVYSPPGYSSSGGYSSPQNYNRPSSSNYNSSSSSDSQKKAEAQRVWDALLVIAPASVKELTTTNNSAAPPLTFSMFGGGIEFSPDGERLAYIDGQAVLRVLRLPGRQLVRSIQLDKKYPPFDAIFSPDNETIAVTQSKKTGYATREEGGLRAEIWNLRSGKKLGVVGETSSVNPLALLNDGQLLLRKLSGTDTGIQVASWDATTGKIGKTQTSFPNTADVTYSAISPDGKKLVVGDSLGRLRWLDLKTGKELATASTGLTEGQYKQTFGQSYRGSANSSLPVAGIDYALNGKWLASRDQGQIRVFDSKAKEMGALDIDNTGLFFSMSPDGNWLVARGSLPYSPQGTLLYNLKTKQKIRLEKPYDTMRDFGFSQDGKQLYGIFADGAKMQFVTWNVDANAKVAETPRPFAYASYVSNSTSISGPLASSDEHIAIVGKDYVEIHYNNGSYMKNLGVSDASAILFSPDGKMLAVRKKEADTIQLWDVANGQMIRQWSKNTTTSSTKDTEERNARSMAFSADSSKLAFVGTSNNTDVVELWDVKGGRELLAWLTQKEPVSALVFSPDNKGLICGGEKGLLQWVDVATRKTKSQIKTGEPIFDIAFAARNLVVMGESNSAVYDVPSNSADPLQKADKTKLPQLFNRSRDIYTPSAISPNGKFLATAQGYKDVQIWELPSGKMLQTLPSEQTHTQIQATPSSLALSFSADSMEFTSVTIGSGKPLTVTTYSRPKGN